MQKRISVILCALLALIISPSATYAAEELFDTKAAEVHIEKGIKGLKAGRYDSAVQEFEAASEIQPDADVFYYLGYAYYMKGKDGDEESRKKAMENFEKAYEINPNYTPSGFKPEEAGASKPGTEARPAETVRTTETETNLPNPDNTAEPPPEQPQTQK